MWVTFFQINTRKKVSASILSNGPTIYCPPDMATIAIDTRVDS